MVFSSALFIFAFLPIAILGYFILPKWGKNVWLLLVSLFFYSWGEPKYIWMMLASILVNYGLGLGIEHAKNAKFQKGLLAISVVYNIGILVWLKYLSFFISIVDSIFHTTILENNPVLAQITMPIGISFFTFQILSYVIDVYRKEVPAQKNLIKLALYISMFPQLIAGPIVRYIDVAKQLEERKHTFDGIYQGTIRFLCGFMKKVLFSNTLAQIAVIAFDQKQAEHSMAMAWFGIIAYTLQIYFDFSGYSDMAIGLGKIFGFEFPENFNYPYISSSIKEFWRRWHISLSTWFRDYLYIPLGGSRKGNVATYRNLFIVFLITGLWHGASFNFIIWGLLYGVFLILERWKLGELLEWLPKVLRHIYTLLIVMIGWVFFRAETLPDAWNYLRGMVAVSEWNMHVIYANINGELLTAVILGILFSTPLVSRCIKRVTEQGKYCRIWNTGYLLLLMAGFLLAVCYLSGSGFNPFIYFRF